MILKRGDTFSLDGLLSDEDGAPVNLTAYALTSQIRYATTLVADLTITKADQGTDPGVFTMTVASTEEWPSAALSCDLRVVDGASTIKHSASFTIRVLEPVTNP